MNLFLQSTTPFLRNGYVVNQASSTSLDTMSTWAEHTLHIFY